MKAWIHFRIRNHLKIKWTSDLNGELRLRAWGPFLSKFWTQRYWTKESGTRTGTPNHHIARHSVGAKLKSAILPTSARTGVPYNLVYKDLLARGVCPRHPGQFRPSFLNISTTTKASKLLKKGRIRGKDREAFYYSVFSVAFKLILIKLRFHHV